METRRTVLLTGATDGIGWHLLNLFVGNGALVIGTGSRLPSALPPGWPTNATYVQADLGRSESVDILTKAVRQAGWSRLDHLVLNAGYGHINDPWNEDFAGLSKTFEVNLLSPMLTAHAFAPLLASHHGLVTLIGSTAAKGAPNFASYAASKAGLSGFARALASEWKEKIDVQIIHPGPTATNMHSKAGLETGFARRFFVKPQDSAKRIMRHIENRKPVATVGIDIREIITGLLGRSQ